MTRERIDAQPSVVARILVDLFCQFRPDAGARLVSGESGEGDDTCECHPLGAPDGGPLELRLRRGAIPAEQVSLLLEALRRVIDYEREARSSAQELSERYEEINLLYSISEILGSVGSFENAAARILTEVMDVLGARRASLWVYHPEYDSLELAAAVGEAGLRGPIQIHESDSATAWVFREKQPMNVDYEQEADSRPGRPRRPGGEAMLSVPINFTPPEGPTRTVGVVTLVGRRSGSRFTMGDERLLSAIASQIGAAIESQRLMEESLKQQRLLRELELAHDLQLKLLPDPDGFDAPPEIAARCLPAESVGGDFYQLYHLSGQRLGILIGDVSSHGFPAALIMALTTSAIGIYAKEEEAPAEVLRRVHRALIKELETTEMYLSLFYGVLDMGRQQLEYANAGHPQAYRIDADGHAARLGATGPPLGVTGSEPYGEHTVPWKPGDLLVLFTDGLSDGLGVRPGSQDGEARLIREVIENRGQPLHRIIERIFAISDSRTNSSPPDDRTLLLVRG